MARRRIEGVPLPKGVQVVRKPSGQAYYYWAPGRGTGQAEKPAALGKDPADPEFWRKLQKLCGHAPDEGTFRSLISEYQTSDAHWNKLRPASQKDYAFHLNRILASAGDRMVAVLIKRDLYQWRDSMARTPATANHAMSIMRALLEFAVQRGYRDDNPAIGIAPLDAEVDGAHPWPEQGWRFVLEHAPEDLRRMAILGRATGQRRSDLVRMRPADRHLDGFNFRISKLRDAAHFVPLTQSELREIESWAVGKVDLYIKGPYTPSQLTARWDAWRRSKEAEPIAHLRMTVHGLRATAVCDRRLRSVEHQLIAAELRLSIKQVERYSRFVDRPALARLSRDRREQAQNGGFENLFSIAAKKASQSKGSI